MNKLPNEAISFIEQLQQKVKYTQNEIILCVPYTSLFYSLLTAQGTNIKIGAQNVHWEESGAYTGEISAEMLKVIGVEYVIVGHSERRTYFAETDEIVNKKVKSAIKNGLTPIICVGENLEQRNQNIQEQIIINQVNIALEGLNKEQVNNIIIAYEPIWAIGTGKTATTEEANDMIRTIRNQIKKNYSDEVAENINILYGGSVKPENSSELFSASDIDGGLVGNASLNVSDFAKIVMFK